MIAAALVSLAIWLVLLFWRGRFWFADQKLSPAAKAAPKGGWPAICAVIPARDEADSIARTVASLMAQDYPGRLDVVVVDDNSTDGTGDLAQGAADAAGDLGALRFQDNGAFVRALLEARAAFAPCSKGASGGTHRPLLQLKARAVSSPSSLVSRALGAQAWLARPMQSKSPNARASSLRPGGAARSAATRSSGASRPPRQPPPMPTAAVAAGGARPRQRRRQHLPSSSPSPAAAHPPPWSSA